MSLNLASYDDAALEALAPKGLVRRARRDLEAGLASITKCDETSAIVLVDGQTVTIDGRGPAAARCSCPAGGICRHILIAVMALNNTADAAPSAQSEEAALTAADEICALQQSDLTAFAGAEWASAIALAAASGDSAIVENGRNCTVELTSAPNGVTFIAGQGLKGAAFKGPKSRARVIVAASAIALRAKRNIVLETVLEDLAPADQTIGQAFLDDAARKLAEAIRIVLSSASPIAADVLFDLAISARAEAAPRLTAQLRGLAKQARQAETRSIRFQPDEFLADAARTFALIEALKRDPANSVLTGSLRRNYQPSPAFELWMLGAAHWRTETGARGLTLHGFAREERVWRSVSIARGAGMDPTFDPRTAYRLPLWGAGPASELVGKVMRLSEPFVADDEAIAPTLAQPAMVTAQVPNVETLIETGAATVLWHEVRREMSARLGAGLRRRSSPVPALLAPASYGPLQFNDLAQLYEWEAIDRSGDRLLLSLPGAEHETARRLSGVAARGYLVLVETLEAAEAPSLRPIAVLFDGPGGLEVINLSLDTLPKTRGIGAALNAAQAFAAQVVSSSPRQVSPLLHLSSHALDAAVSIFTGAQTTELAQLARACEAAGLLLLANAVDRMGVRKDAESSLATAYLASEVAAGLKWA